MEEPKKEELKMKTQLTSLLLFFVSVSSFASELKTVKTPFWQAPQVSEVELKLTPKESDLVSACDHFKRLMFSQEGKPYSHTVERFERFRSSMLISAPMGVRNFQTHLVLSNPEILEQEVETFYRDQNKHLPYYFQEKAITSIDLRNGLEVKINILKPDSSYTLLGRNIGAGPSLMSIDFAHGEPILRIEGKDVACDLVEGNISLEVETPAYVRITGEQQKKIQEFYEKRINQSLKKALSRKTTNANRLGARLGYHFGNDLLQEFGHKFEDRMDVVEELIELFFMPNSVKPTSNLADFGGSYVSNVMHSSEAHPVKVKFSL